MTPLPPVVLDVECFRNFFLVLFKRLTDGQVFRFQISPNRQLDDSGLCRVLREHLLIGFNSTDYDLPMIQLALMGYTTQQLKRASDQIIVGGMRARDFAQEHEISRHNWNHIDLIQVAPLKASLKIYAGRLHCKKLQDLPIDPNAEVTAAEAAQLVEYCGNDLDNTAILYAELESQITLREQLSKEYKQDLRSRSDAQVAEHIIAAEIKKINGVAPGRPQLAAGTSFQYQIPAYVQYQLPQLQQMLEDVRGARFEIGGNGQVIMPKQLDARDIKIGGAKYRMGLGGLHSSETRSVHVADANTLLIDRDVISFYPRIILTLKLFPKHLGEAFLNVYRALVERRVSGKKRATELKARITMLKQTLKGLDAE